MIRTVGLISRAGNADLQALCVREKMPLVQTHARPTRAARLRWLGVLLLASTLTINGLGIEGPCDPALAAPRDQPYGYRLRGDRCEGLYVEEVSLGTLLVASLTESYETFDPQKGGDLRLSWSPPGRLETRVRASGLQWRLYYRMDAVRPVGATSYVWPVGVLAGLNIQKADLGVVAWVQVKIAGEDKQVYVPLTIQQREPPVRSGRYRLSIVPGRELKELFLSLTTVNANGSLGRSIRSGEPLGFGYYPANHSTTIQLPSFVETGIYQVELAADLIGGGTATTIIYIYHRG
jgi:hypothetical protein